MNSLFYSYDLNVESAYIIKIQGNQLSENLAQDCAGSCQQAGMPYKFWDAYDGTTEKIKVPSHHGQFMNLLKITDHYLTRSETACALSHISLWVHCVEIDRPIVILEHDAFMIKPYLRHNVYNSICYLGSNEQFDKGWPIVPTPPHASEGPNYHFICRAHAYAIDPAVAKNLLSHVLKFGICAPLDIIIRADLFPMHQMGIYAYDRPLPDTTILGRPKDGRAAYRNDDLTV